MAALSDVHRHISAAARLVLPPAVCARLGIDRRHDELRRIRLHEEDRPAAGDAAWITLLVVYLLVIGTAIGLHSYAIHHLKGSASCAHMRLTNLNVAGLCLLFLPVWSVTLGPLVSIVIAAYSIHVAARTDITACTL